MDPTVTDQHGFVFLRQLAVHLRIAIQQKNLQESEFNNKVIH